MASATHMRRARVRRSAFTLVELLVVITIISTLIGLLLPAVQAAREAARRNTCANNSRQLGLAMLNFESSHKTFPGYANTIGTNVNPVSWVVVLFPYMEHSDLYNQWAGINGLGPVVSLKLLTCPTDPAASTTKDASLAYVCNRGVAGFDNPCLGVCMNQVTKLAVGGTVTSFTPTHVGMDFISSHDGTSMTLLLNEQMLNPVPTGSVQPGCFPARTAVGSSATWTNTTAWVADSTPATTGVFSASTGTANPMENEVTFEWGSFKDSTSPSVTDKIISAHSGGANMCFCDGHQSFVSNNLDLTTFKALMTPWGDGIARTSGNAAAGTLPLKAVPWVQTPPAGGLSAADFPATSGLPQLGFIVDEGTL